MNLTLERDLSGQPPAGVPTDVRRHPGQVHTIFGLARAVDACATALRRTGEERRAKMTAEAKALADSLE